MLKRKNKVEGRPRAVSSISKQHFNKQDAILSMRFEDDDRMEEWMNAVGDEWWPTSVEGLINVRWFFNMECGSREFLLVYFHLQIDKSKSIVINYCDAGLRGAQRKP